MIRLLKSLTLLCYLLQGLVSYVSADDSLPLSYHWGRGVSAPAANLNIGGYFNATYQQPETSNHKVSLDSVSFLISWNPFERLRFFSEVETEKIETLNFPIQAERLYLDWLASPSTTVRLGKFLTPIGHWNLIHAAPLIWTTSRPIVNDITTFSPHLNGLMLMRALDIGNYNADISFYADSSGDLDVFDKAPGFQNALGGHFNFEFSENLKWGLSFINFQNDAINKLSMNHFARNNLVGVDFSWKKAGYELELESIYRQADDVQGNEKGFYLQGVVPLIDKFYAIGRYEDVNGTHNLIATHTDVFVTALAWRPFVPLVLKAEYRFGDQNQLIAPSGFYSSIAMFF